MTVIERTSADFYDDPVIYDVLHTPGTAGEVRGLRRIAERFHAPAPPAGRTWLEPACGTGRYLRLLARREARVIGFDADQGMIAYARRRVHAPNAALFVADMASFARALPPASVDVAFNLVNSIRHLSTDHAMLEHLTGVRRALKPGGLYVVGLHLSAYGLEPVTEDLWRGARGPLRVTQIVQFEPPRDASRVERVISQMIVTTPSRERHIASTYDLRTYSRDEWRDAIRRASLRIAGVVDETGRNAPEADGAYALFVLTRDDHP